jgi:hypothetical protein
MTLADSALQDKVESFLKPGHEIHVTRLLSAQQGN